MDVVLGDVIDVKKLRLQRLKSLLDGLPQDEANDIMIKAGLIRGRTPRKTPTKIVTRTATYKTIYNTTVCKHCGSRSENVYDIHKDEEFMTNTDEGRVKIWRGKEVKDGLAVTSYVNYCWECDDFIKTLPRFELERRYIQMMKNFGMKMVGSITTVGKKEDKANVAT